MFKTEFKKDIHKTKHMFVDKLYEQVKQALLLARYVVYSMLGGFYLIVYIKYFKIKNVDNFNRMLRTI